MNIEANASEVGPGSLGRAPRSIGLVAAVVAGGVVTDEWSCVKRTPRFASSSSAGVPARTVSQRTSNGSGSRGTRTPPSTALRGSRAIHRPSSSRRPSKAGWPVVTRGRVSPGWCSVSNSMYSAPLRVGT
ncbi:MAG TPA: hypothetical protein VLT33_07980 [Labilithrix sp.]|nr:hypothetical protein [Labilithrix sp.]